MELEDYKALPVDHVAQSLFGKPSEGGPKSQWIRWQDTLLGTATVHRTVRPSERYQWWTASVLSNPNQGAKNALNLVLAVQNGGNFPIDTGSVARACRQLDGLGLGSITPERPTNGSAEAPYPYPAHTYYPPARDQSVLERYLRGRGLPAASYHHLQSSGQLYLDRYGYPVFVHRDA